MTDQRTKHRKRIVAFLATMALLTTAPSLLAAGKAAPATPLTDHGTELFARYSELLKASQAEVTRSLPVDAPRSGSDFLLETQARGNAQEYLKVLRAQWASRVLGEQASNDRKQIAGGFWSGMAHDQTVLLADHAVELGPLGQELAEATEAPEKQKAEQATIKTSDQQVVANRDGSIVIPAVAHGQATGSAAAMKSYSGGMQIHCNGGYKSQYLFQAPRPGKYMLIARVATLQEGQKFLFAANDGKEPVEVAVPYTIGLWHQTKPIAISLSKGQNVLNFELPQGSRGVTIKDFTLRPSN